MTAIHRRLVVFVAVMFLVCAREALAERCDQAPLLFVINGVRYDPVQADKDLKQFDRQLEASLGCSLIVQPAVNESDPTLLQDLYESLRLLDLGIGDDTIWFAIRGILQLTDLEHFSINRSAGAVLGQAEQYLPPVP